MPYSRSEYLYRKKTYDFKAYARRYYKRLRKEGRCTVCKKPEVNRKAVCPVCAQKKKEQKILHTISDVL